MPELLTAPPPRIGLFWGGGNPAALPQETRTKFADVRLTTADDAGSYRRPLDPVRSTATQLSTSAWQPVGARGAAVGHVQVDRENGMPSSSAVFSNPYASNPLIVTDSTIPPMQRVRARLEGAMGWETGPWAAGLAIGVEARDHRTSQSSVPRIVRVATPALTLGATRSIPFGAIRLSAYSRWQSSNETAIITPLARPGTVFQLEGYSEVDPRRFPELSYFRRAERQANSIGIGVGGSAAGAAWNVYAERARRSDNLSSDLLRERAGDGWRAKGGEFGVAAQRLAPASRFLVTIRGRYSNLAGDATRADLSGSIFRTAESSLTGEADIRYAPSNSRWLAGTTLSAMRERRDRQDFIAELGSNIDSWTSGGSVEIGRHITARTSIAGSASVAFHVATAQIPNPESLGPLYVRLFAPELALHSTPARPTATSLTIRHAGRGNTVFWVRGRRESLAPSGNGAAVPFTPIGSRVYWAASLGVTTGR